jgi:hypothetical protein
VHGIISNIDKSKTGFPDFLQSLVPRTEQLLFTEPAVILRWIVEESRGESDLLERADLSAVQ